MSEASDFAENEILDHMLAVGSFTSPTSVYLALFTSTATGAELEAGTLTNEVANAGSYARLEIGGATGRAFSAAASGSSSNSATWDFPQATGNWGVVRFIAIMTSATHGAGNVLFYTQLDTDVTINTTDTFSIPSGNLTVTCA